MSVALRRCPDAVVGGGTLEFLARVGGEAVAQTAHVRLDPSQVRDQIETLESRIFAANPEPARIREAAVALGESIGHLTGAPRPLTGGRLHRP